MYIPETTRHSVYNINYHMVWVSKYRKHILINAVAKRAVSLIHGIAKKYQYCVLAVEVMPDHVHLFCSAKPNQAPSTIIKIFKGTLARVLFKEFPQLKKGLYGGHLWRRLLYQHCRTFCTDNQSDVKLPRL